ncbi:MAG: exonuclease domain-containing protein [Pseudomonadota bacterium]
MFAAWRFDRALRALENSEHAVLRDYARAAWPERSSPASEAPFLALDFEMDGLRKGADLLQAGWLPYCGRAISLGQAQSWDIRSKASLDDQAVVIHGIGEQRAMQGRKISEVVDALVEALAGRIMVAHAAWIEVSALQRATNAVFGADLPIRRVCTLQLEQRLRPELHARDAYRLANARRRYGLPDYAAHDALTDALAAAELLQAQLSRMGDDTKLSELER